MAHNIEQVNSNFKVCYLLFLNVCNYNEINIFASVFLFLFHLYELNVFLHFMWHCSPISLSKTFFICLWCLLVIYLYALKASKKFLLIVFKLLFCLYCSSILLYVFISPIFAVTVRFNPFSDDHASFFILYFACSHSFIPTFSTIFSEMFRVS